MDLKDKVVLITGGTSGFGKATAISMVKEGAKVIVASIESEEKLKSAQEEIGCIDCFHIDVTCPKDWDALRDFVKNKYSKLDVLLNIAGGGVSIKETVNQSIEEIDKTIMLNLNSVIYGSRVFGQMMKDQCFGTIINFASVCAKQAWPEWTVYAAAKWGVLGFSKGLYVELQPYNVRVTTVIPGSASTGFQKNAGIGEVERKLQTTDIAQVVTDICKLPSHVVVEEVIVWGIDQVVNPL